MIWIRKIALLSIYAAVLGFTSSLSPADLPRASPEEVGMSSARLKSMHRFVSESVESYPLTGAITLVARHGKVVDLTTYGYQDIRQGTPMREDGIFALASMTKTIVSAGAMILVEQGKIRPADPIEKYLPEFRKPRVFVRTENDQPTTRSAKSPILVRHLLTHTAGWPANGKGTPDLARLYAADDFRNASSLEDLVAKLSALPLQDDPGTAYVYGPAIDVLGALIQRVSGMPLEDFLQQHLFGPLNMSDTFFEVPADKRNRLVQMFSTQNGQLVYAERPNAHGDRHRHYPSGGGGLYSTVADYYRFAQMLLDGGELEGERVLGPKSIERMSTNLIRDEANNTSWHNDQESGFGLGVSVKKDQAYSSTLSSLGTYGWSGYASTLFFVDPEEDLIAVFMSQHVPTNPKQSWQTYTNLVYQAIVE